jgi:hypothetical protein
MVFSFHEAVQNIEHKRCFISPTATNQKMCNTQFVSLFYLTTWFKQGLLDFFTLWVSGVAQWWSVLPSMHEVPRSIPRLQNDAFHDLNIYHPPSFICWNASTQCNDMKRWDLWKVIRSWMCKWNLLASSTGDSEGDTH